MTWLTNFVLLTFVFLAAATRNEWPLPEVSLAERLERYQQAQLEIELLRQKYPHTEFKINEVSLMTEAERKRVRYY